MEEHPSPPFSREAAHRWPLLSGLAAVALAVALGVVILALHNGPLLVDRAWMDAMVELRAGWLDVPALVLNFVGGGWFAQLLVPLATVAALLRVKKWWGTLYYALAVLLSVLVVQLLKAVFDRPRPEQGLVLSDAGSFPSGHVANAATIAVTLALIFRRAWIWYVGAIYTVAMALSRTYLGVHWLSDTVGGALIGAGIAVIVWVALATQLNRERKRLGATDSA